MKIRLKYPVFKSEVKKSLLWGAILGFSIWKNNFQNYEYWRLDVSL